MVGDALSCPMSEQYVIGALARFPELMTGDTPLTERDFADPINRRIYSVMQKVAIRNHIADFASITDEMAGLPDGGELQFSYTLDSGAETLISRNSVLITVEPLKKQETEVE